MATRKKAAKKKAAKKKKKTASRAAQPGKGPGAPAKFKRDTLQKIREAAERGAKDYEISQVLCIDPSTFSQWKTTYPELIYTLEKAREKACQPIIASMYQSAVGYSHWDEKIFYNAKTGQVKRVPFIKHYAPNTAAAQLWLRAYSPEKDKFINRVAVEQPVQPSKGDVDFETFCERAGYPEPFEAQIEMKDFGIQVEGEPRLLLGSRGYGKTDYTVIMGVGYQIYLDPTFTCLLVTKSPERNAAIIAEVAAALRANGVSIEKENASCLRVEGLRGKDHSLSAITIGASSIRGRHPKLIIMDDPVTEEDVSEATRKKVQRVYNELNKLVSNLLVIGQPVHKFDLYETLRPVLKKMEVPHGTIPELDHDIEAQRLAGVSEESIQASYFLKVISEVGYPLEKVKYLDKFPKKGNSVAFIDPSFEGGDYTALTIIKAHFDGVAVEGHVYKKAWYHCLDEMAAHMEACGVKRLCFETNSLGDQPVVMLRDTLEGVGVVGKKSTGHKHSRIVAAGAFAHLIHLAKTSDQKYIDQVVKYEYGSKYDDAPDSLASAMEWIGLIRGKK